MMERRTAASFRPMTAILLAVVSLSAATAQDYSPPSSMVINIENPLYAGHSYEVTCRSMGWTSLPEVTWWLGNKRLTNTTEQITYRDDMVEVTLLLTPMRDDNLRDLMCRAEASQRVLEKSVNLTVYESPPPTSIRLFVNQIVIIGNKYEATCNSTGWNTPPNVSWWLGDQQLIGEKEEIFQNSRVFEARLQLIPTKDYDGQRFKCRMEGSQGVMEDSVNLTTYKGPTPPYIVLFFLQPLSAGQTYEITCKTWEWHSPSSPEISWWLNGQLLTNSTKEVTSQGNKTTSTLVLTPTPDDHRRSLKCRAEALQGYLEDTVTLNVYFAPIIEQQFSYDKPIEEGSRVYFGCVVRANPRTYIHTWMYQGRPFEHNPCASIMVMNQGLAGVYNIKRHEVGEYTCIAGNVEGETVSSPVRLNITYQPSCRGGTEHVYVVPRHEMVSFQCDVDALPPVEGFRWAFSSSSAPRLEYVNNIYTSEWRDASSQRNHTPIRDEDYGSFYCWARNYLGEQVQPCTFHVVPPERPSRPRNCSVTYAPEGILKVKCSEDVGGGHRKKFMMEAFNVTSGKLLCNETWLEPLFLLPNVGPGQRLYLRVTAISAWGRSESVLFATTTPGVADVDEDEREERSNCSVLSRTSQSLMMVCLGGFVDGLTQSTMSEVFDRTPGRLLTKSGQKHQTVMARGLDTRQQRRLRMLADGFDGKVAAVMVDVLQSDPKRFTIVEPLSTRILLTKNWLIAYNPVMITCRSAGSRPPARVDWWLDDQRLFETMIVTDENETLSTIRLTPHPLNDQSVLTCRAQNPHVPSSAQEHSVRLSVLYIPNVTLEIERPHLPDDIREGDNVTLKCKSFSNPPLWKMKWLFQGRLLRSTDADGDLKDMATLNLKPISRKHSGDYACVVSNALGDASSCTVRLTVKQKPTCRSQDPRVYIVPRGEEVQLECQVDAFPQPDGFEWMFNSSMETDGTTMSFVEWTNAAPRRTHKPVNDLDYGTFYCWAFNSVGVQDEPCAFHVAPPGRPNAPSNCSVLNMLGYSFEVQCATTTDGGRRQSYRLEVFEIAKGHVLFNKTQPSPAFLVDGMEPYRPMTLRIAAVSHTGLSEWVRFDTLTLYIYPRHVCPDAWKKPGRRSRRASPCSADTAEDPCPPIKVPRL